MQIEIEINTSLKEPKIIIQTDKVTDEIHELIKRLTAKQISTITGFREDIAVILDQYDIVRFYASNGKVFAAADNSEYAIRLRLYELEESLDKKSFVRISNSEIVNLNKVRGFDLSLSGTILVKLSNGTITYVSRRYVAKIKKLLGL